MICRFCGGPLNTGFVCILCGQGNQPASPSSAVPPTAAQGLPLEHGKNLGDRIDQLERELAEATDALACKQNELDSARTATDGWQALAQSASAPSVDRLVAATVIADSEAEGTFLFDRTNLSSLTRNITRALSLARTESALIRYGETDAENEHAHFLRAEGAAQLKRTFTDAEIDEFERQRHVRRMPGYQRLQAERGAALMKASLQRLKKRKRK